MKFSVFQLSRRGGRPVNEDRMGYCYTREAALFVLADGMGGHARGEVAAQLALQTMAACFQRQAQPALADVPAFLAESLLAAHAQILRYAQLNRLAEAPRSTLVAAVVQHGQASWVHCGDSRLLWVRAAHLLERTRDHSYLEMERTAAMQISHRLLNRNVLYTCLGAASLPVYDSSGPHRLHSGDRLLLCSDGLWGVLQEAELVSRLSAGPVAETVPALVEAALRSAGSRSDNVTALALEWEMAAAGQISTEMAADQHSLLASTIQSSQDLDGLDQALDEAEIERNIAEIKAAIQRSALRRS